jgi:hypothetical protein
MSRKIRNDNAGSNGSTDRDIPLNLSNLSTTPTFSNVALHNLNVARDPMSPVIPSPPSHEKSSINQTPIYPTPATGNPMQSISTYNQPMLMSTFSFSRMASSMQSASMEAIQLPAMVEPINPNNISSNVAALQQPNYNTQLGLNSQQFVPPPMAAVNNNVASLTNLQSNNTGSNRWGGMFRGPVVNSTSGLMDRRR